jgi:type VI secretion system secreted protein VgrG
VARSAKGMLITTEARTNAASHMKDMGETVQRLTSARDQHETLADIAQQAGAQEKQGQQVDIAKILKAQNDAIKGSGASGDGTFPELSEPHLVLASPAGIETTTSGSTHIASGGHTAITTGKSLSIASGDSLFASIGKTFRLFVQKAGMKMVAAAGDVDVKALKDSVNLLAKLNITHTANRITITAKEEVLINGGGSYVKYNAGGIEHGTNGAYIAHGAVHSLPGPRNMAIPVLPAGAPMVPLTTGNHSVQFLMKSQKGKPLAEYSYVMESKSGLRYEGITDSQGQTMRIFTADKEQFIVKANTKFTDNDVDLPPASERFV